MKEISIIFPAARQSQVIHPFWAEEAKAAEGAGFSVNTVTDPNDAGALRINGSGGESSIYRGWMVKPQYYKEMSSLRPLLNDYDNLMWSYEFPKWYDVLKDETPHSLIIPGTEISDIGLQKIVEIVIEKCGTKSLILKDYLKSRKHEWFDACFIKDASDFEEVARIASNFFYLQGKDFYGGLVFRDFIPLKKLGFHPTTKMPIPIEFRTFFFNQKPFITSLYWNNDLEYPKDIEYPPQSWIESIGKKLTGSSFVALDIAQAEDDQWYVIER